MVEVPLVGGNPNVWKMFWGGPWRSIVLVSGLDLEGPLDDPTHDDVRRHWRQIPERLTTRAIHCWTFGNLVQGICGLRGGGVSLIGLEREAGKHKVRDGFNANLHC